MAEIFKNFTPQKYEVHLSVDEDCDGQRLDQFCQKFLHSFSRQQVKQKIAKGEVKIQGRPYPHKASVKVYYQEVVEIFTPRGELEDEYWNGEKLILDETPEVIFEDKELLVISKPAYMATHPTGKHLFNCATVFFENKLGHTIHSIHRLDRETSGVLMLGKSPQGANIYTEYFEENKIQKCYFFIAHNNKKHPKSFTANERLGEVDSFIPRLFVHCFPEDSTKGKHAQTHFEILDENNDYVLGLAFPKTGRQHQIRSHAAHYNLPLIGDKLYNGDPTVFMRFKDLEATSEDHDLMLISRHALHAMALKTPYRGEAKTFRSNFPRDLKTWLINNFDGFNEKNLFLKIDTLIEKIF